MISVVIANYNGVHFLGDCINSIKKQTYNDIEIIVVDNGSTDNSVSFLKDRYPEVRVIKNKKNLGFVAANNKGFVASRGEYVLFLNNDTKLDHYAIKSLLEKISGKEDVGAVFSKLLLLDEPSRLDAVGSYLTDYGFLYHIGFREVDTGQYNKIGEIFSPKGVCFLVPKRLLEEIGGFDEDYFSYFEESDLFWRIWLSGKKILFAPNSIVYHKVGGTCKQLPSDFIDYHSFKNRICTLIKNLGLKSLCVILPLHIFLCFGISFLYLCNFRFRNSLAVLKATSWNLFHLRSTLRKRSFVQRSVRKISDKELFKIVKKKVSIFKFIKFTKIYLKRW